MKKGLKVFWLAFVACILMGVSIYFGSEPITPMRNAISGASIFALLITIVFGIYIVAGMDKLDELTRKMEEKLDDY
jgi:hypothetical protein